MINVAEDIAYWYLRLNGFFPLHRFVLHSSHPDDPFNQSPSVEQSERVTKYKQGADIDLIAVRFPYVYERIGGLPEDWDDKRFSEWGFSLGEDIIGLIVEVKNRERNKRGDVDQSFNLSRTKQAIHRMGMFKSEDANTIAEKLHKSKNGVLREGQYCIGKLLISHVKMQGRWANITLEEIIEFTSKRKKEYGRIKDRDSERFPSEWAQMWASQAKLL